MQKNTGVTLDKRLWAAGRARAKEEGRSFSAHVAWLLRRNLSEHSADLAHSPDTVAMEERPARRRRARSREA
jgi:hypothetical protein